MRRGVWLGVALVLSGCAPGVIDKGPPADAGPPGDPDVDDGNGDYSGNVDHEGWVGIDDVVMQ